MKKIYEQPEVELLRYELEKIMDGSPVGNGLEENELPTMPI